MSNALLLKRLTQSTKLVDYSFTRPGDTTTYAVDDVICDSTSSPTGPTFTNMARRRGGGGIIQQALLLTTVAASLKLDAELWLFDAGPTVGNDNSTVSINDGDNASLIGIIPFYAGLWKVAGPNAANLAADLGMPFQCTSASRNLFGLLIAKNAYIPSSSEQFKIRLSVLQD